MPHVASSSSRSISQTCGERSYRGGLMQGNRAVRVRLSAANDVRRDDCSRKESAIVARLQASTTRNYTNQKGRRLQ
jgi:hypothetical protein